MRGLTLSLGAALLLTGCMVVEDRPGLPIIKSGGPPPWAPAYGHRAKQAKHAYHFYPALGIYVNLSAGTYFYMSGGRWMATAQLPPSIVLGSHDFVTLELATDKPYLHYEEHEVKFKTKKVTKRGKRHGKKRGRPF